MSGPFRLPWHTYALRQSSDTYSILAHKNLLTYFYKVQIQIISVSKAAQNIPHLWMCCYRRGLPQFHLAALDERMCIGDRANKHKARMWIFACQEIIKLWSHLFIKIRSHETSTCTCTHTVRVRSPQGISWGKMVIYCITTTYF